MFQTSSYCVTGFLAGWAAQDRDALDVLLGLVYNDLGRPAYQSVQHQRLCRRCLESWVSSDCGFV
jgi:hypothetical protein